MKSSLVVVKQFGQRLVGDLISGSSTIASILEGYHKHNVVRVAAPPVTSDKAKEL